MIKLLKNFLKKSTLLLTVATALLATTPVNYTDNSDMYGVSICQEIPDISSINSPNHIN